jgi:hypothetical protein
LWTKEYGDTMQQFGWQCKRTRDNGFVIAGQTNMYSPYADILLIKTDSNGVEEWVQHYGGSDYEAVYSVDTCIDGGFIICGYTMSYGVNPNNIFGNGYLVKTDSLGNLIWQKSPGGYFHDEFQFVIQSADGFIYAFGISGFNDDSVWGGSGMNKPSILKVDTAGNIQWEKSFGDSLYNLTICSAEEFPNGDFVCGGFTSDSSFLSHRALLLRINNQGDSLLYKTYEGLHSPVTFSFFYDVSLDKDKGYVCTGMVVPVSPDTGTQDIWILKLDSNGCEIANCIMYADVDNYKMEGILSLYPNPSDGIFYIHTTEAINSIQIINCIGKEIEFKFQAADQIDLSAAPEGIYIYRIITEQGNIFSGKLIKQ